MCLPLWELKENLKEKDFTLLLKWHHEPIMIYMSWKQNIPNICDWSFSHSNCDVTMQLIWCEHAWHHAPWMLSWALMCDNVICSVLYTLLVFSSVCLPPYPQFTAAKGSPCPVPVQVVYLSAHNFLLPHPPSIRFLSRWLSPSFHCPLPLFTLSSGFDLQSR